MTFQSIKDVRNVISGLISEKVNAGQIVQLTWVVNEILTEHNDIEGNDVDFYAVCAKDYVTRTAKACIARYDNEDAGDVQLVLDGCKQLRRAYPMHRSGDHVLVPIDQLTIYEVARRALEHRKAAKGHVTHEEELIEFGSNKWSAEAMRNALAEILGEMQDLGEG